MARTESSPDPSSTRRIALQIVPDTGRLDGRALEDAFERLHSLDPDLELEFRLVAREDTVEYYVTVDSTQDSTIEHTLRRVFPAETSIERDPLPDDIVPEVPTAALECVGWGERRDDWQTRLKPVLRDDETLQFPAASVVDTLADADSTVVYQTVITPKPDWRGDAEFRIDQLKRDRDTPAQRLAEFIFGEFETDASFEDAAPSHQQRIESIRDTDPRQSFTVNVRAVADGSDAKPVLEELGSAFQPVSNEHYRIVPRVYTDDESTTEIADQIDAVDCIDSQPLTKRLRQRLPITQNDSRAIVADPLTTPNFCLLDGESLTHEGRRAMQATPEERTGIPRPDDDLLSQYDHGMLLGYPLTSDRTRLETPVALPPSLQDLHTAWFGKTGSGKSTALINAMLWNHEATSGANILIDPKGDGMPIEYLKAHYARYGDLENVYYFDCRETLPAISFFDIRDQLDDGIYRTTAIENIVDHYVEMLVGIMGSDRFWSAVRSPDIIQYLVKAMFDPVHGADAFRHRELQEAASRMHETRDAPPVSDQDLQRMLSGVAANSKRSFDELMQGVANRIEKVPLDDRLGQLFNHIPEDEDDPQFDFRDVIDEDAVVIVNTGALRSESQRTITLVLLSELWSALQRRHRQADQEDLPLVNLYLEEAATIASSGLVTDLLARSRAFGLSMTLAMQFPAQLRQADHEAYAELLNNVSTIITGNVAVDDDLAKRLATEDMPPSEVANRLRGLHRGQWFASLPSEFGVEEPRPFLLESAPIPAGHPESDEPFSEVRQTAFDAAMDVVRDQTRLEHGIDVALQTQQARMARHQEQTTSSEIETDPVPETEPASVAAIDEDARLDSALPYTNRMPDPVEYDAEKHALLCANCENRFDPTSDGMRQAINCCHSDADVTRDEIPICELNLKLSAAERRQSPYTDAQLRFLQAVYMAHQQQFDAEWEYDLLYDSMVRLQEYVDVSHDEVQELLEAGVLAEDCSYPHKLYTVTAEGREAAKIDYTEGVGYGHGEGDLGESSLHVMMVELSRRYLVQAFVDDPSSPVVEVMAYYEADGHRYDVVGLDADGNVIVVVEAERSNHDTRTAVPADYDKMAALEPEEAIWVVKNRDGVHDVLKALNEPPEGEPRVDKVYSQNTPPQQFQLDFEGMTELHTLQYLRDSLLEQA
ncbi:ATP-binding protein [Natronomonas salina]|uniref:type IV secretory system conjugative DNA transfer family protein n=1 Tax=Natronomonas salina TaxID=1710540 RepID=UPI0015B4AC30|nr:ATP-binding protein [Natronomonas salina]QLD90344.1 ATP-binding protein [Natronomonas salina]